MSENISNTIYDFDSFQLRVEVAANAEKTFIRYCIFTIAALVIVAVAKGNQNSTTVSLFGYLDVPQELIVKQIWIVRIFFTALLGLAFVEWAQAIIDLGRHPLAKAYSEKKLVVITVANWWDSFIGFGWLYIIVILDIIHKFLFFLMVGIIIAGLWIL